MIEELRRFVPLVTFIAGTFTTAVGAFKLSEYLIDPGPAYDIISAEVLIDQSGKTWPEATRIPSVKMDVIKLRPECRRRVSMVQFRLKDGTERSAELDFGSHLTPGRHLIVGKFKFPDLAQIDITATPIVQTIHGCGEGNDDVTATCSAYYSGAVPTPCK